MSSVMCSGTHAIDGVRMPQFKRRGLKAHSKEKTGIELGNGWSELRWQEREKACASSEPDE